MPELGVAEPKSWVALELDDGWYGLPSFEFLALTAIDRETSDSGLQYASPCTMALANLLSHETLGAARMSTSIGGREILRSAKDLGRVLALAWLAGPDETDTWSSRWRFALEESFPERWRILALRTGAGLRALLDDASTFEEAWFTCDAGLLSGKSVTQEQLQSTARRLLIECIEPLEAEANTNAV